MCVCLDETKAKINALEKMLAITKERYEELGGVFEENVEQSRLEAEHMRLATKPVHSFSN